MKLSALGEEAKDINLRLPDIFDQKDKHYPKPTSYRGEDGQKTSQATACPFKQMAHIPQNIVPS